LQSTKPIYDDLNSLKRLS